MPKLEKGSAAAKEQMAHLRSLRKKKEVGTGGRLFRASAVAPAETTITQVTPEVNATPINNLTHLLPNAVVAQRERRQRIGRRQRNSLERQRTELNQSISHLRPDIQEARERHRMHYGPDVLSERVIHLQRTLNEMAAELQQINEILPIEAVAVPEQVTATIVRNNHETNGTGTKKSPWILHVSKYAKTHGISYFQALKMPEVREEYKKAK